MKKLLVFLSVTALCALCALPVWAGESVGTAQEPPLSTNEILTRILVCFLVAITVSLIVLFLMKRALSTVRKEKSADRYTKEGSFSLTESRDIFLYSTVTRVRVNTSKNRR